jgi:hypothetical protein
LIQRTSTLDRARRRGGRIPGAAAGSGAEGYTLETCAEQYHLLREIALDHPEARGILVAID